MSQSHDETESTDGTHVFSQMWGDLAVDADSLRHIVYGFILAAIYFCVLILYYGIATRAVSLPAFLLLTGLFAIPLAYFSIFLVIGDRLSRNVSELADKVENTAEQLESE